MFKPLHDQYKGKDLGELPSDAWKVGGGTCGAAISYHPDLDVVFHGTSNPSPWNDEVRPETTIGIFVREPASPRSC